MYRNTFCFSVNKVHTKIQFHSIYLTKKKSRCGITHIYLGPNLKVFYTQTTKISIIKLSYNLYYINSSKSEVRFLHSTYYKNKLSRVEKRVKIEQTRKFEYFNQEQCLDLYLKDEEQSPSKIGKKEKNGTLYPILISAFKRVVIGRSS